MASERALENANDGGRSLPREPVSLSADDSMLDSTGEARFVKRLFIASNSALANCLGGPNPTLTNQALSTRTAETILRKYFDGEPFVGRETPVSSIDDRVTRAVLDRSL